MHSAKLTASKHPRGRVIAAFLATRRVRWHVQRWHRLGRRPKVTGVDAISAISFVGDQCTLCLSLTLCALSEIAETTTQCTHRHARRNKWGAKQQPRLAALPPRAGFARWCLHSRNAWSLQHRRSALWCPWHQLVAWLAPLIARCSIGCHIFCVASVLTAVWRCRRSWICS